MVKCDFKLINISMETINQKNENQQSMNFVGTRSVMEKLIPNLKLLCMARGMCENKKKFCMFYFK